MKTARISLSVLFSVFVLNTSFAEEVKKKCTQSVDERCIEFCTEMEHIPGGTPEFPITKTKHDLCTGQIIVLETENPARKPAGRSASESTGSGGGGRPSGGGASNPAPMQTTSLTTTTSGTPGASGKNSETIRDIDGVPPTKTPTKGAPSLQPKSVASGGGGPTKGPAQRRIGSGKEEPTKPIALSKKMSDKKVEIKTEKREVLEVKKVTRGSLEGG